RTKIQVGDKFRINLGLCAASMSFVYAVDQNVGGNWSAALDGSNKVVVTYNGPSSLYFELTQYVKVRVEFFTGLQPGNACSNPNHQAPQSCGAFYENIGPSDNYYSTLT